jgi:hypothetical protein
VTADVDLVPGVIGRPGVVATVLLGDRDSRLPITRITISYRHYERCPTWLWRRRMGHARPEPGARLGPLEPPAASVRRPKA